MASDKLANDKPASSQPATSRTASSARNVPRGATVRLATTSGPNVTTAVRRAAIGTATAIAATTTGRRAPGVRSEQKRGGKEPDPNSPFAKLLALKEQLEGNKR